MTAATASSTLFATASRHSHPAAPRAKATTLSRHHEKPFPLHRAGAIALSLLIAPGALASKLAQCRDISSDQRRLECFDAIADAPAELQFHPVDSQQVESQQKAAGDAAAARKSREDIDLKTMQFASLLAAYGEMETFHLAPLRSSYFLPASYNRKPNPEPFAASHSGAQIDHLEAKFQISGKIKLANDLGGSHWDWWFGYTQVSWWQIYNDEGRASRPFRETNYAPETFATWYRPSAPETFSLRQASLGFVHQSNGRAEPLSRSWNRIYASIVFAGDVYGIKLQPWYRIKENAEDDNNPDIDDYLGYGDYIFYYKRGEHLFNVLLRNNLDIDENRGAVQIEWGFPLVGSLQGFVQYYNGYGESLLDYDHYTQRLSVGLMIYDWL